MKTSYKAVIAVALGTGLFAGGFFTGRKAIPVKVVEKTIYEPIPPIHDSIPYPVYIAETVPVDPAKIIQQCVRDGVFTELFPERILKDYRHFMSGRGYEDTVYDKFFIKLRNYKYGRVLYSLNVLILKIASLFMPGARFVRFFPFRLPN